MEKNMTQMINTVPWYGKTYKDICDAKMLQQVQDWINFELNPERAIDYKKYLISWCGFPSDFMRGSGQ